jgi:serine-type D-Ala-D-Ala carboxypeptidase (penicillin-binding protein 5/6)
MDDGRRKTGGLIVAALLVLVAQGAKSQDLTLAAQSAALVDSYSGEFLYSKNADAKEYPASSTKILTALIVIEAGNLDQMVTVAPEDTKVEPSSLNLKPGQQFTRRQLLFGMLLKSANDVAMCLARDNAGSVPAFAEKMNLRAAELGATSSHFVNPHGLHDPNHYTTAHDLVLIARAAMQQPLFRQIVSTIYYTWKTPNGEVDELRNHNRLLRHFAGCNGLKTGYTRPAQQVLVSSALRGGHEVISVVLHTDKPGIWVDSKTLLTYGLIKLGCPADEIVDTTDRADEAGNADEGK